TGISYYLVDKKDKNHDMVTILKATSIYRRTRNVDYVVVAHGACIRSGKPAPSKSLQIELVDELRARVADGFVKRWEET
nr:OTU domain-containing protein At3g57810-like [Tanacetum cinerariifolium]